ncbi:HXXEE domain-containing protein [Moorena sp. SIO4G3]|uniref:HXXEE domain-containing protein n=1 Tax=Moorena sp. SIO4G3 TaxID=2607821 RepID=UPI001429DC5E|nr:HXXEE domain-containing protein [Moorena sp. SIO4G3]NEO75995.1 HXXEE domain-containing protein [Moorena sp. SIO4G3]
MSNNKPLKIARSFWFLGLFQVAHSIEETVSQLYLKFAPMSEAIHKIFPWFPIFEIGADLFASLNYVLIGLILGSVPAAEKGTKLGFTLMWVWGIVELLNGVFHIGTWIVTGSYFPGGITGPIFFVISLIFLLRLNAVCRKENLSKPSNWFTGLFWLGTTLSLAMFITTALLAGLTILTTGKFSENITLALWIATAVVSFLFIFVAGIQLAYRFNCTGKPIVLEPKFDKTGPTVGVIYIQGEGIPVDRYVPVAEAIQDASTDLQIWVGLPRFLGKSPIPRETGLAVNQALRAMKKAGMPKTANLFYIAHSVGGIAIQKYIKAYPERAKGLILTGSFLGKWNLSNLDNNGHTIICYPVPVLTIGGTLDGLARITRIAAAYWYQQENPSESSDPDNFPVVTIDQATHMQFASGPATSFVKAFDLTPQVDDDTIHKKVGELVYHFIRTKLPETPSEVHTEFLANKRKATKQTLEPIIKAFIDEGYNGFKPACYNRQDDNTRTDPCCTPFSPWIQDHANEIMAGSKDLPPGIDHFELNAIDSFHRSSSILPVHLPQIRNQCNGHEPCKLTITSVTQALYGILDALDTGLFPIAAFSLRTKLNSRQKFWKHAGVPHPDYNETDGPSRGAEINQHVYQWAIDNASESARLQFERLGVEMVMGEDFIPVIAAGPLWLYNYPKFVYLMEDKKAKNSLPKALQVRSTVLKTPINYWIKASAGFHYCQLLSPATVTEWIYVDSLRAKGSLSGNLFIYGPWGGLRNVLRFFLRFTFRQTRTTSLFLDRD